MELPPLDLSHLPPIQDPFAGGGSAWSPTNPAIAADASFGGNPFGYGGGTYKPTATNAPIGISIGGGSLNGAQLGASGDVTIQTDKTTSTTVGTENTSTTTTTGTSINSAFWNGWFVRGVVMVLGLIFVAEGLHMFGVVPSIVPGRR